MQEITWAVGAAQRQCNLPPMPPLPPLVSQQPPTAVRGCGGPMLPACRDDTDPPPGHESATLHAAACAASHRAWSGTFVVPAASRRASAGSRPLHRSRAPASPRTRTPPPRAPSPTPRGSARRAPPDPGRRRTPPRRHPVATGAARAPSTESSAARKLPARCRLALPTTNHHLAIPKPKPAFSPPRPASWSLLLLELQLQLV